MVEKKITIVTVNFNNVSEIEKTIQSVINQDYKNIEYIIIDGGSSDGSMDIVMKYENKIHHVVSEKDSGIYNAMNKGIQLAGGEYINFMNSGDTFTDNKVISNVFANCSTEDIIYGHTNRIIKDKLISQKIHPSTLSYSYLIEKSINHQAMFVKSTWAKKLPFDENYKMIADWDFLFRAFHAGATAKCINIPVANFDITGFSNLDRKAGDVHEQQFNQTIKELLPEHLINELKELNNWNDPSFSGTILNLKKKGKVGTILAIQLKLTNCILNLFRKTK
jgi:glycosyltransferase involved in cell wall biosynthesis